MKLIVALWLDQIHCTISFEASPFLSSPIVVCSKWIMLLTASIHYYITYYYHIMCSLHLTDSIFSSTINLFGSALLVWSGSEDCTVQLVKFVCGEVKLPQGWKSSCTLSVALQQAPSLIIPCSFWLIVWKEPFVAHFIRFVIPGLPAIRALQSLLCWTRPMQWLALSNKCNVTGGWGRMIRIYLY